ncbi:hypothetical protein ACFFLM_24690 [Deinococcus oregonensis]|uniref:Uncharacterized protein n=1 Tax=Deinococcus oregonensis TaxID=1805970 RepID=A0ABV6B851_9DEIO
MRQKLTHAQLPAPLAALVDPSDFLKAFDCPETQTVVVWRVNKQIGKQQELEFSLHLMRGLTRPEREAQFPAPAEVPLPALGAHVMKRDRLEEGTDVRYETYDVYLLGQTAKITQCEQIYFAPALMTIADVVQPALENALFAGKYLAWSVDEKVSSWVAALYRLRRQMGETGADEDNLFSPRLLDELRLVDANIEAMLPSILHQLATMETSDPKAMLASFNSRTRLSLVLECLRTSPEDLIS